MAYQRYLVAFRTRFLTLIVLSSSQQLIGKHIPTTGGVGKAHTAKSFDELLDGSFVKKLAEKTCKSG